MRALFHKIILGWRRGGRVRALEEEMRTHLELLVAENQRRGLDATEARRQAHVAFGNLLSTREESSEALGWPALESWWQDLRLAARSLIRRPAFALSLILILSVGIGATTAIFTLVRGMLLEPLPVPRPAELYLAVGPDRDPFRFSAPTVTRLEADPAMHGRVIAYTSAARMALRNGDAPAEPFSVQFVNGGFFQALQLGVLWGRPLTPADDEPNRPRPVVVVSHSFWKRKLGGDPAAVGRSIRVNGQQVTVVGVTPASFTGVSLGDGSEAWMPDGLHVLLRTVVSAQIIARDEPPTPAQWMTSDYVSWQSIMVRQAVGRNNTQGALEAAWRPQMMAIVGALDDADVRRQVEREVPQLVASPQGFSYARDDFRRVGLTLSLLVGAVVLVTAANSSTLLLLRMLARSREMGVRLALGAGRWRLARGALMEGLVLSLAGSLGGFILGVWLTPILAGWLVPGAADGLPGVDVSFLAGLGGLAVLLGLMLGAAPAWLSARLSPQSILQQRSGGGRGSLRIGRALIVVQLALSVMLVAVAGALSLDLRRVLSANLGFARESVITTFFDLNAAGIEPANRPAVLAHLREAAETLPQVRAVGFAAGGVLSGSRSQSGVYFRGAGVHWQQGESMQQESIDEHYFDAMGMTLLRGRNFTANDVGGKPPVAIVSQRLARQVFGEIDPIGRRFGFDQSEGAQDWEVVGVLADARVNDVHEDPAAMFYTPLAQWRSAPGCLVARVDGDGVVARQTLQRVVSAAEPSIMFTRWLTLEERVRRGVNHDLATVRLTLAFGAVAMLLAIVGVLGALGYLVASRSREIAVRLAIGADPRRIWRELMRDALRLGLAGAAGGLMLAALLPRVLGSWMMTGLQTNWVAIALAALAGFAAALLGGMLPARRAAKVDPLVLLRSE